MRRKARAQQKPKGPLQRLIDREANEEANRPLVTPEAARHGDYGSATIPVGTGEFDGEGHGQKRVTVNRGGSTVRRWEGSLSRSQLSAIALYSRLWHRVFSEPRLTAGLSPIAFIRSTGDEARHNAVLIDAKETLAFLDERIFDLAPGYYKSVWQDVVIFDRPAHDAAGGSRSSAERAKTICLFIADMIATALRL